MESERGQSPLSFLFLLYVMNEYKFYVELYWTSFCELKKIIDIAEEGSGKCHMMEDNKIVAMFRDRETAEIFRNYIKLELNI
jgi:hypothetical protein